MREGEACGGSEAKCLRKLHGAPKSYTVSQEATLPPPWRLLQGHRCGWQDMASSGVEARPVQDHAGTPRIGTSSARLSSTITSAEPLPNGEG